MNHSRDLKRLLRWLPGLLLAFAVGPVFGQTWQLAPQASIYLGYNDSVLLQANSDSSIAVLGFAQIEAGRFTERATFKPYVGFNFNQYDSDLQGLNEDVRPYGGLTFKYLASERSSFYIDARFLQDLTNQDSISESVSEEVSDDTQVGFLTEQRKVDVLTITPEYSYGFSERLRGTLRYRYRERSFKREGGNLFPVDNERGEAIANLEFDFSEQIDWLASVSYLDFETENNQKVDGYSVTAGLRHKYSETSSISYELGISDMEFVQANQNFKASDDAITGRVVWTMRGERSRVNALLRRSQTPSLSGGFVTSDLLSLNGQLRFSEYLEALVSVQYFENESDFELPGGQTNSFDNRNYLQITPSVRYNLTESWNIEFGYTYRSEDREGVPSFDSNEVKVGVSYIPIREF